jgi:hypothetical protein
VNGAETRDLDAGLKIEHGNCRMKSIGWKRPKGAASNRTSTKLQDKLSTKILSQNSVDVIPELAPL